MIALLGHPAVLAAFAYLAATLLFQFRPFSGWLPGLDQYGILPRWKFFVALPEQFEVALALRSGPQEDEFGDWIPVPLFPPRTALHWLWFPQALGGAVLLLSAHRVVRQVARGNAEAAPDGLAYATLARHARHLADAHDHATLQFALVQPDGTTLFTSGVHRR